MDDIKNPLNYRPSFKRDEKIKTGWKTNKREEDKNISISEDKEEIGTGLITTLIDSFQNQIILLKESMKDIEFNQKDFNFNTDVENENDIKKAKEKLDLPEGPLTLLDYKVAILNNDTSEGDYLTSIIETITEGVEGNIEIEIYSDYIELVEELNQLTDFYEKNIMVKLKANLDYSKEDWQNELIKLEKEWFQKVSEIKNQYELLEVEYRNAILFNSDLIFKTTENKYEKELDKLKYENELNRIENVTKVIQSKDLETKILYYQMEKARKREPFKDLSESVFEDIVKDKNEKNYLINELDMLLSLSIDNHNGEKKHFKESLRNIYNPKKQKMIAEELTVHENVFENTTLPVLQKLKLYNEEQEDELTMLLEEVSSGMLQNLNQKKSRMEDIYRTSQACTQIRLDKIKETTEKDNARQAIHLLSRIREGK